MIVEKSADGADEAWIVHPCPGYLLKFKQINLGSGLFPDTAEYKLFLNICHCEELPAPLEDLEEDQVAEILDSNNPSKYKIPLCIGELECVRDNKNENSAKIDVVVNSGFFKKRLEKSEFFRQLLLLVASEAIRAKHDIKIESKDAIRLRNRKVMGEISAQRIRKRPEKSVVEEIEQKTESSVLLPDENDKSTIMKNCLMVLHDGQHLEIKCKLPDLSEDCNYVKRIRVKMNDDHLLIHDHFHTIVDFYVPLKMDFRKAKSTLFLAKRLLKIVVPVSC